MELNVEGRREREKPRERWLYAIGYNMKTAGVCVDDMGDHVK